MFGYSEGYCSTYHNFGIFQPIWLKLVQVVNGHLTMPFDNAVWQCRLTTTFNNAIQQRHETTLFYNAVQQRRSTTPFNNTVRQPLPDSPLQSRPTGNHYLRSLILDLENPLGVIVILALGLSGTLLIVISRHSCSGTILTIVERGAVATLHQAPW